MTEEKTALDESKFAEWIPRLIALTAIGSAFAYGVGWLRVRYYAEAMGAAWYLPSISQQAITNEGWSSLADFIMGIGVATVFWLNGETLKTVRNSSLVYGLFAISVYTYAEVASVSSERKHLLLSAASFFACNDAGIIAAELTWGFGTKFYRWGLRNSAQCFVIAFFTFQTLPAETMRSKAASDLSPSSSQLPRVENPSLSGDWRLLFLNGDVALLIRPAQPHSPRATTIIEITEGGIRITTPELQLNQKP